MARCATLSARPGAIVAVTRSPRDGAAGTLARVHLCRRLEDFPVTVRHSDPDDRE
jgi:hypothetical protein